MLWPTEPTNQSLIRLLNKFIHQNKGPRGACIIKTIIWYSIHVKVKNRKFSIVYILSTSSFVIDFIMLIDHNFFVPVIT